MSLSDEYFEFVPAGSPAGTPPVRVKCIDALANLYIERFYGSGTAPWTGPSGRELDLTPDNPPVIPDYDQFIRDVVAELIRRAAQ